MEKEKIEQWVNEVFNKKYVYDEFLRIGTTGYFLTKRRHDDYYPVRSYTYWQLEINTFDGVSPMVLDFKSKTGNKDALIKSIVETIKGSNEILF